MSSYEDYAYECARDAVDEVLFYDRALLDRYNELLKTDRNDAWVLVMDIQNYLTENVDPRDMVNYLENDGADMVEEAKNAINRDYADEFGKAIA